MSSPCAAGTQAVTEADALALCTAVKLDVLALARVGAQIAVTVAQPRVTPETVIRRLGVPVTVSFSDGRGDVTLWFEADSTEAI